MTFAERLTKWADDRFGSVAALSRACGIGYTQLAKYASGAIKSPGLDILEKLAAVGADLNYLILGNTQSQSDLIDSEEYGAEIVPSDKLPADLMLRQIAEIIARYEKEKSDEPGADGGS